MIMEIVSLMAKIVVIIAESGIIVALTMIGVASRESYWCSNDAL